MVAETYTKEQSEAVEYFERKLQYEFGPVGLDVARKRGDKLQIIDLREPELFAKGHIPSAVNVSFDELEAYLQKLNKEIMTVVYSYDHLCYLPTKAAWLLAKHGYRVKEFFGGFDGWAGKQYEVEVT